MKASKLADILADFFVNGSAETEGNELPREALAEALNAHEHGGELAAQLEDVCAAVDGN
jgi:hypothetical protein